MIVSFLLLFSVDSLSLKCFSRSNELYLCPLLKESPVLMLLIFPDSAHFERVVLETPYFRHANLGVINLESSFLIKLKI